MTREEEIRTEIAMVLDTIQGEANKALWFASHSTELVEIPLATRSYYHNDFYQRLVTFQNQIRDMLEELLKMNSPAPPEENDEAESTAGDSAEF